jgi:hypothetical protein
LIVGELVAYAPHVDETRWVGTLVASEVFQLGDEVTWLLTGEPREVGRYRVAVETVADRTNLSSGYRRGNIWVGEVTRALEIGAAGTHRGQSDSQRQKDFLHLESPKLPAFMSVMRRNDFWQELRPGLQ